MMALLTDDAPPDGCEDMAMCDRCSAEMPADDAHPVPDGTVCDGCVTEYRACEDCADATHLDDGCTLTVDGRGDTFLCDGCADDYHCCYLCSDYVHSDNAHGSPGGDILCNYCRDRHVSYCDDCDCEYWLEDGCDCRGSDDGEIIRGYGYKPAPAFHGQDPNNAYYGVELEMECPNGDRYGHAATMADAFGSFGYLKADSSLQSGFECVTHPAAFPEIMDIYPWGAVASVARAGARSWQGGRCGVHIHVSRRTFTDAHMGRFLWLFYNAPAEWQALAGRHSSSWAKFDDRSARIIGKLCKKLERPRERYTAVNLTNDATLEVRIFRGTLNTETLRGYVAAVAAAVEYTRHARIVEVDRRRFGGLVEWARGREEYRPFIDLVDRKVPGYGCN